MCVYSLTLKHISIYFPLLPFTIKCLFFYLGFITYRFLRAMENESWNKKGFSTFSIQPTLYCPQ